MKNTTFIWIIIIIFLIGFLGYKYFPNNNTITGNAVLDDNVAALNGGYQEIRMDVTRSGWNPNKFVLQKGIPVK